MRFLFTMGLLRLYFLLGIFSIFSVVGFGVDPTLRINVFDEIKLGKSFPGVSQVPGFHNESRAFLFQDMGRNVKAPAEAVERMVRRLRNRSEFTILATLKQEQLNSGVILSIHNAEHRFLELESSGQRNEIRLHYHTRNQQMHSEVFPYTLADNQWHKVSIAMSASHVLLHVDCNRIYERVVETPVMDLPRDTSFWLGQRNKAHGFFKMEKCDRKSDRIKKSVRYFESDDSGSDQESDNATDLGSDDSVTEAAYEDGLDPQLDFEDTEDPPPPGSKGSGTSQPTTPVKRRRPSSSFSPSPSKGRTPPTQRRKGSMPTTPDEGRWNLTTDPDVEPQAFRFCPTRKPGVQLDTSKSYSPLELFQLFFDQSVVRTLCANTNKNAQRLSAQGRKCPWVPLTVNECYHFLGMVIFMGLLKVFTLADYWGLHRLYGIPFCRSVMARKRFEAIIWTFHMSDPDEDEENKRKRGTPEYDRLFSLKPLLDSVVLSCKAFYHPRQNLSIDERMVRSRAKIMLKQHMKSKPIKWGFKLFVLADSHNGYTYNFTIYQGRCGPTSGKGLSYTSVMNLIDVHQLGTGYRLYVDNFYTSTALFRDLYGLKIGACGTIRENRLGFPRTKVNSLTRKSKRGEIRWIRDKELLFVKWKDTREVAMCTSIHTVYTGDEAQRRLVTPDGKWTVYSIPVPTAVRAYNRYMGGVDLSDALIKYYNVGHKTKKWYKTLFYHFVDIAAVNAFLLQKEMAEIQNTRPLTQKKFREKLCQQLVDVGEEILVPKDEPEQPSPAKPKPKVAKTEKKKACIPVCITEGLPIDCSQKATKGRKYCVLCSEERSGLKTIWKCEACEVPLCLIPDRNCFRDWHSRLANSAEASDTDSGAV